MPRSIAAKNKTSTVPVHATMIPAYRPPTIGQSIKEGFGVGVGVSLANRIVSGIFGPPTVQTIQVSQKVPTVSAFEQCIAEHRDDVGACAHLASGQSDIKK
jgi:hypothetical protein